jgi:hypothetical protein
MSYLKYRGRVIRDCVDAGDHSGRWIIQTYHQPTGNPWSDELCPHYPSLRAAKESILADMEEGEANARLIAAAPDLLAIVEFLHEWVAAGADVVYLSALFGDSDDVTLGQAIRDAIAATR